MLTIQHKSVSFSFFNLFFLQKALSENNNIISHIKSFDKNPAPERVQINVFARFFGIISRLVNKKTEGAYFCILSLE